MKIEQIPCMRGSNTSGIIKSFRHVQTLSDRKPDLVLHPQLATIIQCGLPKYVPRLADAFNVFVPDELPAHINGVVPVLVAQRATYSLRNLTLEPYFRAIVPKRSGQSVKPEHTTYQLKRRTPLFHVPRQSPRYVIWTRKARLTVCGTVVDRVDPDRVMEAIDRALDWSYPLRADGSSVAVFDLDESLVTDAGKAMSGSRELVAFARTQFDYLVLYSHGSALHVDQYRRSSLVAPFDLVLSHDAESAKCSKNLLALYNHLPAGVRFTRAVLVDDSIYNWTPEYTHMLVPERELETLWAARSELSSEALDEPRTQIVTVDTVARVMSGQSDDDAAFAGKKSTKRQTTGGKKSATSKTRRKTKRT